MYLLKALASSFGPGKIHHQAADQPLTGTRSSCGLELPGAVHFQDRFARITCKNCQQRLTGRRRVKVAVDQLDLFGEPASDG